jgi:hypothetical protein
MDRNALLAPFAHGQLRRARRAARYLSGAGNQDVHFTGLTSEDQGLANGT